jgi:tricorn protease
VGGGLETKLPVGIGSLVSFSPDGKQIAFNRWSTEFRTWKRYRGGTAPDLWVGDIDAGKFKKITDWEGTDDFPNWYEGRIYFLSDRAGRANIHSCLPDGSDVKQHSQHKDFDVRWPDLSAGRMVYMLGGDLWTLEVTSGESRKIDIKLPSDRLRHRPRFEDAGKTLDSFALNRTGSKVALSSRGEMWICPPKEGLTVRLTESSGVRERSPVFSPDGKQIAAITDQTGEQEIALYDVAGKQAPRVLTKKGASWVFDPIWSPEGTKIAYADMTFALYLIDVTTGDVKVVDQSKVWEIREYAFSPDGKWLAYTRPRENQNGEIVIYNLADAKSYPVSTEFTDDYSPSWDPKGKYLYFLSNRSYNPMVNQKEWDFTVSRTSRPYALILTADGLSPFLPEEMLKEREKEERKKKKEEERDKGAEKKDEGDKSKDGKAKEEEDEDAPPKLPDMKIDIEGIQARIVEFPKVKADSYAGLSAIEGKIFYVSSPQTGMNPDPEERENRARNSLLVYDLKKKKSETFIPALRGYTISDNGKKLAYRGNGDEILLTGTDSKPGDDKGEKKDEEKEQVVPSKLPLHVKPDEEWVQIFDEAWRFQRDFYWAENMAGVNWQAMRDQYRVLLPRISTRNELNDLIGQLIAELGTSHTYVSGGDTEGAKTVGVGLLGADLAPDTAASAWKFLRVLRPEVWETEVPAPLTMTHARVKDGDLLLAINGRPLTPTDNVYERLAGLADQYVRLNVCSNADKSDARDIQIKTLGSERELRYRDWCRRNREYVERTTEGKIGYFHLPDMGGRGMVRFIQGFYPQVEKQALIIDERYNGGGNVSSMITQRLLRKVWAYMRPRRGIDSTYPDRTHFGHKAVLINHWSGSDGDIFPESFKLNKLGPVIGKRSWGGVVGIRSDKPFIDGGMSTQPEFAWWDPTRGWNLENRGVDPDIDVDVTPEDELAGRDPQLDRTIAELNKLMKEQPMIKPAAPPIPNKGNATSGN